MTVQPFSQPNGNMNSADTSLSQPSTLMSQQQSPATVRTLDSNVAMVSPAIYAAASKTTLTREEKNLIENWAKVKQTHESLLKMKNSDAVSAFNKLSPDFQQVLKTYYNTDYANKPDNTGFIQNETARKILGLDNGLSVGDVIKSPFRFLMEAGTQYGKLLNTPINMIQNSIINRESFWTRKNADAAFDGKYLYDENAASDLVNKYGNANAFVAMHVLAGDTPGEIIDAWGPNDPEILKSINSMFNEKQAFGTMLNDFSKAQLSPGRDVVRWFDKKMNIDPTKTGGIFNTVSGSIDAAFQIFADPMTYLTMGGSAVLKGAGESARLAEGIKTSEDVAMYLSNPKVGKYFDGYARLIGQHAEAVANKDETKLAQVRQQLNDKYSNHSTPDEIALWSKPEYEVKDLASFSKIFLGDGAEEFTRLIRGRTNNASWAREGGDVATTTRSITMGAKQFVKDALVGKMDIQKGADEYKAIKDILVENGQAAANNGMLDAVNIAAQRAGQNAIQRRLEKLSSLHPGRAIVYNDDENVAKSLETFKRQAFMALGRKDLAELATAHFLTATQDERIALQKSIFELNMRRSGIQGLEGGEDFISKALDAHFGESGSFASTENLTVPTPFGDDAGNPLAVTAAIHASQFKNAIKAPDWRAIQEFAAKGFIHKGDKNITEYIPQLIGGAYNNKVTGMLTDLWTTATLVPQLGIRTAIDEGFTYLMYANGALLRNARAARAAGNIATALTGSDAAVGPVKKMIQSALSAVTGKPIGAMNFINDSTRESLYNAAFSNNKRSYYKKNLDYKNSLIDLAMDRYGEKLNDMQKQHIRDLLLIHSDVLKHSSAKSLGENLLGHGFDQVEPNLLTGSQLDKSLAAAGIKQGDISSKLVSAMSEDQVNYTMFNNFYKTFNGRPFIIGNGKAARVIDIPAIFLKNNAIRKTKDYDKAMNDVMKAFGFAKKSDGSWFTPIGLEDKLKKISSATRQFKNYEGLTTEQQFYQFAKTTLADIYHVFHGSPDQYNSKLMGKFYRVALGTQDHKSILASITQDDYNKLTEGYKIKGRVYSDLKFDGTTTDFESWIREHGINQAFEAMGRQTDAIMRQPVVHMHYLAFRKQYSAEQSLMEERIANNLVDEGMDPELAAEHGSNQATHFFTMRALDDAVNHTMKFSDNPEMQTVLAYNMRTVGRFYRSIEDFHRRMYRLVKDHSMSTLLRLRLMSQGMDAVGSIHTDPNGEKYLVMPMDNVIYGAVDNAVRLLTNNKHSIRQPLFDNITFNLTAGNPSFQTDAGMPYLSGPMGALSVLGVKSILGKFDPTKQMAENIDTAALGSMGDNITLKNAIMPKFVKQMWSMLSPDEQSQQEVSALTQAISYNAANGIMAPDPTDKKYILADGTVDTAGFEKDKTDYLKNLRISAHNLIVTRTLLGMVMPMSVQAKDTRDLPTYLQDNGIQSMQAGFYDLLDQVNQKYPDAANQYELAIAAWMGKNPGKIAYLVSKKSKQVQPILKYSNQMQNWVIKNQGLVDQYGAGAMLFAPQAGQFSPGVYQWATAAGLANNVDIAKFYDKISMQQHVNAYYDLDKQQLEALKGIPITAVETRRQTIQQFQDKKAALEIQVPGLANYIASGADNSDAFNFVNDAYNFAKLPNVKIDANARAGVVQSYELYTNFINYCNYIDSLNSANGPDLKRQEKSNVMTQINALIKADSTGVVDQYYKYGLRKLINAKSKDAISGINGNVY